MAKQELFERSPIRAFDEATNGGLKAGELGLVTKLNQFEIIKKGTFCKFLQKFPKN